MFLLIDVEITKHIRKIIERCNKTTLQNQKYRIFLNKIINQII